MTITKNTPNHTKTQTNKHNNNKSPNPSLFAWTTLFWQFLVGIDTKGAVI